MMAFENLNYRERAMVSAHLGFCVGRYATHYYEKDDLDEDGKPIRKPIPEEAFIDIAIDHGLASPDTADKTYRKALSKIKKELKTNDIDKEKIRSIFKITIKGKKILPNHQGITISF